jgi:type II secretion system protein G
MNKVKKGFTLIELLVVMAIIGILAAVIMVSLNSSHSKAHDTKRASDVKELEGAIELYFSNNGQYPSVGTDNTGYLISTLQPALVPNYLATIPQDPLYPGLSSVQGDYQYVRGDAGSYGIWVYLETAQGSVPANSRCITGVNINTLWFGGSPQCPF